MAKQKQKQAPQPALLQLADIYSNFVYDWNMSTDFITWQQAAKHLLKDLHLFENADRFVRNISIADFEKRINALHNLNSHHVPFDITYDLYLPGGSAIIVNERAALLKNANHLPVEIRGHLTFVGPGKNESHQELAEKGEDKVTGLMNYAKFSKLLSVALKDGKPKVHNATMLQVMVERTSLFGLISGLDEVNRILIEVAKVIKQTIRATDHAARISGNTFGLLLLNCDNKEITVVAKKLIERLEEAKITPARFGITIGVSMGGTVVQDDQEHNVLEIMQRSATALQSMQFLKQMSIPIELLQRRADAEAAGEKSRTRRKDDA